MHLWQQLQPWATPGQTLFLSQCWALRLGSLSIWKTNLHPSPWFLADYVRFFSRISLCTSALISPSTLRGLQRNIPTAWCCRHHAPRWRCYVYDDDVAFSLVAKKRNVGLIRPWELLPADFRVSHAAPGKAWNSFRVVIGLLVASLTSLLLAQSLRFWYSFISLTEPLMYSKGYLVTCAFVPSHHVLHGVGFAKTDSTCTVQYVHICNEFKSLCKHEKGIFLLITINKAALNQL